MQIILNSLAYIIQILHLNQIIMLDVLIGLGKKTKMPISINLVFFSIILVFLLPGCDGSSFSKSFSRSADEIFDDSIFSRSADGTFDSNEDNPIYILDSTTDNNLTKKDVLEHLEKMANNIDNPGKHPDPDIEKIYDKIDKGTDETVNISDFDSRDKSIFWLLLRILSFLCANIDDGQDPNKPYKECTRKYLLEQIEEGSAANNANKDAFRRWMMVHFNMYMFAGLLANSINSNGKNYYSVHGITTAIGRALFSLETSKLQKSCNDFKFRLSTIIPFISSAGHIQYWANAVQYRRSVNVGIPQSTYDFADDREKSVRSLYDYVDKYFPNGKYDNSLKNWQYNDQGFSCKLMKNLANVHVDLDKSDYPYEVANWNHPHSRCGTAELLTLTDPLTELKGDKPLGDYCNKPSYKNGSVLLESSLYQKDSFRFQNLRQLVTNAQHGQDAYIFNPYRVDKSVYSEEYDFYLNNTQDRTFFKAWRYKRSKEVCGEPKNGGDGSNSASAIGDDPCKPNTVIKAPVGSIDPDKAIDNNKFLAGGTTPNPDYNPVNPWSNIGNIGKIAKLIEMHRKVIKAVAEFEDRQIKINLQKPKN